jgi:hypothetical protein
MSKSKFSLQSQSSETDLIESLFDSNANYPWNPAHPESDLYYSVQEQQFSLDDWSEAEVQKSADSFFAQLSSCWPDASQKLVSQLCQKFATRIPQYWLEKVAAAATQVAHQQIATANQLVGCVQELLPNWAEEDLLVLARPYSFAMRSDINSENLDNLVRSIDWDDLSKMEQAKLTMLVSKYAIDCLADASND